MTITTEIVSMKTVQGIQPEAFINIVDALERDFHGKQAGFMDSELLYNEASDEWIMVQHWRSAEELKAASQKMFKAEEAATFIKALETKTVKMKILPQLGTWQ